MFSLFGAAFAMTLYKKNDVATNVSWKNYTRPTPPNVLMYAEFIQGILLSFSTISMLMSYPGVALTLNIMMIFVNQAVKLVGKIVEKSKTESVTAEYPSGEKVTVTHDKPKDEGEG